MKKLLVGLAIAGALLLLSVGTAVAVSVCTPSQGCTGKGTAAPTDVGKALIVTSVSSTNPSIFTYGFSPLATSTGIASFNNDTSSAQLFELGTSGTDATIVDSGNGVHVLNLPTASASNRGLLNATDWSTFNNKLSTAITSLNSDTSPAQFLQMGTVGSDISWSNGGGGVHILNVPTASASVRGALSSSDWSTFNSKIGGSGTANQIALFNGAASVFGDGAFFVDPTNKAVYVSSTNIFGTSTIKIGALNQLTQGLQNVGSAVYAPLDIVASFASSTTSTPLGAEGISNQVEHDMYGNSNMILFAQRNNPYLLNKSGTSVKFGGFLEGNNGAITIVGPNIDASSTSLTGVVGIGTVGAVNLRNGVTANKMYGTYGSVGLQNSGAGSVLNEGDALIAFVQVPANQTANTMRGLYVPAFTGGGTIGTSYAVLLDDPGAGTTRWGLASNANQNYFGGNTIFGASTTPAFTADVHGTLGVTATSTLGVTQVGGGSAGHAVCFKADGKTLGYCSTQPDAGGSCTCN